ncbi:MAG: hypothetical protein QG658_388 [Patescibacteria group bacterium]|jgi:thiol:disulfide interchange protein|nr:hypothetical protein [Patescibacteria group bacterium]
MPVSIAEVSNSGAAFLLVMITLVIALIISGIALFLFVLWILMLIDALARKDWQNDDERMMWTIVLILSLFVQLWGIAAVVYYYVIKRPRTQPEEKHQEAEIVAPKAPTKTKAKKTPVAQSKTRKKSS